MFSNQLKLAFRNLLRRKGYGLLNVGGLAVGIAGCLLIVLFARSEWAVNADIPHVDRLYRVDSEWREQGMGIPMTTLAPVGQTLVREYPEVETQTRIYGMTNTVRVAESSFREDVMLVDTTLFDVFELPFVQGDRATALDRPRSVVLSARRARAWFGVESVVGRIVDIETWNNGWQPFTVTGVLADLPYNSFSNAFAEDGYDVIIPYSSNGDFVGDDGWGSWQSRYILQVVRLVPDARADLFQAKLAGFIPTYAPEEFHGNLAIRLNAFRTIYLTEFGDRGFRTLRLLAMVAAVILLLACINFANLATARSLTRVREIGVRKAIGAHPGQVARQFLGESLLAAAIAGTIGLGLALVAERPFMALFDRPLMLGSSMDPVTLFAVAVLVIVTGLVSGAWPALVFSRYRPVMALRDGTGGRFRGMHQVRRALVVLQFTAAIVLVISLGTITAQLRYIAGADLGFRAAKVLVVDSVPREWSREGLAKAERVRRRMVEDIPEVLAASVSWETAVDGASNTRAVLPEGRDPSTAVNAPYFLVDDGFLETFDVPIVAGRFFSADRPADSTGIVLNERAAREFGWTADEALGQRVQQWFGANAGGSDGPGRPVIGVVADHHFELMRRPVRPAIYLSLEAQPTYRVLSLRLDTDDLDRAVREVQKVWKEDLPMAAFEHYFLDDRVEQAFQAERQVGTLVGLAAALALFLAGMGILALASLSVARRTKEVGVRRVLGASVGAVVILLSREFVGLVAVSAAIAVPVAFVIMRDWIQAFAYGGGLSWATFLLACAAVILFAGLVVGARTVRAATADPAASLRYE